VAVGCRASLASRPAHEISDAQLAGWRGFLNMVHTQRTSLAHLNDR
jgi:hypothetical protein